MTEREYIKMLKLEMLGSLSFSVSDFYSLEPREIGDIIDKKTNMLQYKHRLEYIATLNAIGQCLSEKYNYVDVFDESDIEEAEDGTESVRKVNKEVYTEEEQDSLLDYFSNW